MKNLLFSVLLAITAVPLLGQQTKVLTAEKHNEYGLVYSLPLTALQVEVTIRKETKTAGPFSQYARRYLGTDNVIGSNSVVWTITDVKVTPYGVKDDDRQYLMQLKPGATTFIGVASDGMILSINTDPLPVVPVGEKMAVSEPKVLKAEPSADDYLKYVNMDFLSAQSSLRQAEMVADVRLEAIEARNALADGTSDNMPSDFRQLELMIKSLDTQIDALTRAFAGTSGLEEYTAQFSYIPSEETEEVLFRLSDFSGIVDSEDYSGSPVYIKTEITDEGTLPEDVNGEPKKFPKDGVVYAIPGAAKVSIFTDRRNLFAKEYEFSQFGTTFGLAPTLFTDKKSPTYARFSPVTGALVEIGTVVINTEKTEKTE